MDQKRSRSPSCDPKHSRSPTPSDDAKRRCGDCSDWKEALEIVLTAIKTGSVDAVSEHEHFVKLYDDREFCMWLLDKLDDKREAGEIELGSIVDVFRQFPEDMRNDFNVVEKSVLVNSDTFKYAGDKAKSDPKTVLRVLADDAEIRYVNKNLLKDIDFVESVVNMQPYGLEALVTDLQEAGEQYITKDVAMLLVKSDPSCLEHLSKKWRNEVDVVKVATEGDLSAFRYASEAIHSNDLVIKEMLKTKTIGIELKNYIIFAHDKEGIVKAVVDEFESNADSRADERCDI
jgi:hypothetical protein